MMNASAATTFAETQALRNTHHDNTSFPTSTTDSSASTSQSSATSAELAAAVASRSPSEASPTTSPTSDNASQLSTHIRFRGDDPTRFGPTRESGAPLSSPTNHEPPPSPRLQPTYRSAVSLNASLANSPSRIKVRDLSHIQSFASEEVLSRSRQASRHSLRGRGDGQKYEISAMPVTDIIEMVAGLLTKITTTNDKQHEDLRRQSDNSPGLPHQASSVLAFHGKNVPSITIASYLTRIHKYCPTTYEVFISLLVYFDRMTETINDLPMAMSHDTSRPSPASRRTESTDSQGSNITIKPDSPMDTSSTPTSPEISHSSAPRPTSKGTGAQPTSPNFVVDSFNIHRLIMAGVTCASKFFSDVFYTNSRYAKVGGLPLLELNHLELQFLLLNDFRLSIPIDELEAYGTMLVEFYASEVVTHQQQQIHTHGSQPMDGIFMSTQPRS